LDEVVQLLLVAREHGVEACVAACLKHLLSKVGVADACEQVGQQGRAGQGSSGRAV